MKFKTAITHVQKDGGEIVRGFELSELVKDQGFINSIFLILTGKLPSASESRMFDALLTSAIDHGPATGSALTARISASAKNPLHASLAAGLLGMGERHGAAVTTAMQFLYDNEGTSDLEVLLQKMKAEKKYAPGFGHRILEEDTRALTLLQIAKEEDLSGKYCEFAQKVKEVLNSISSKKLPLNVDGAMAAILCDMGFDARLGSGIFIIARMPGLVAQTVEEIVNDEGIRKVDEGDVEYIGE